MANENFKNIRVGLFVITGTLLFILALYLVGSQQNLFGDNFTIRSRFYNVNGLTEGNNVRFAGINVGTVESVEILNDTAVDVVMTIEKKIQAYIKKNAIATVGTDGLMGNKLVNINSVKASAAAVEEGDVLVSMGPVEMDEMVRTLNVTNENIKVITTNLRGITDKINSKNSLWSLLMDTVVSENVKSAVVNLKLMSDQGISVTGNIKGLTEDMLAGKGSIGALITDTMLSKKINQTVVKLQRLSDTAAIITGNISYLVQQLKQGKGSLGILLHDTSLVHNLNKSILSIDTGAVNFNENMKALKYTWPFKKYFKKNPSKR